MEIGQASAIPILVVVAICLYFYLKTPKKSPTQQVKSQTPQQPPQSITPPTSQLAWISINDQKPELYKKVIIYTDDKEILYNWTRVNNTDYIHSVDNRTINNVTHWINIESPPYTPQNPKLTIVNNKPKLPT